MKIHINTFIILLIIFNILLIGTGDTRSFQHACSAQREVFDPKKDFDLSYCWIPALIFVATSTERS
jgi:hypothetical protein